MSPPQPPPRRFVGARHSGSSSSLRQVRIDNFLNRNAQTGGGSGSGGVGVSSGPSRQMRITDMRGVVVVEDLYRCKELLKSADSMSANELLETLNKLAAKQPSRELLKASKIGSHVKRLTNHSDCRVAQAAGSICESWLAHFIEVESRRQMDVACDAACSEKRRRTRQMLAKSLGVVEDAPAAVGLERELFFASRSLVNHIYRDSVRQTCALLSSDENLRAAALVVDLDYRQFLVNTIISR